MERIRLKDLLGAQEVFTLQQATTVGEALAAFRKLNIISAPVLNEGGVVLGLLDVLDIVTHLCQSLEGKTHEALTTVRAKFVSTPVRDLMGLSRKNEYVELPIESATLKDACSMFAFAVHRLHLTNEAGKIVHVYSQSAFVRHLSQHGELLGDLKDKAVMDLGLGSTQATVHSLVSVRPDTPAIDAFNKMRDYKLSAIAIVEEGGQLQGQLSASDLRGLSLDPSGPESRALSLEGLLLPVSVFTTALRHELHQKRDMLVWCLPGSTVWDVVQHIVRNRVHRIYLIDLYVHFYGVVSITDIAKLLAEQR